MVLENKLGITASPDLQNAEERLSKMRAVELFTDNLLDEHTPGSFQTLAFIHHHLFQDIYDFAGQLRRDDISKGSFRFASQLYLPEALKAIERMPQSSFDKILEKYVEMNVAHPFREGNGRSMRIWLDHMLKTELGAVVDWSQIDKTDYLLAMERSPIKDTEIKHLLSKALTKETNDRQVYIRGIDASYAYEGYETFKAEDL